MRRALRWVALVLVVALAAAVGYLWPVLVRPELVVGQDAVTDAATTRVLPALEAGQGGRVLVARPPAGTAERDVLVVFYPGGLVRPQAYEWLARALAARGYLTVVPEFSFDLAVTDPDRASGLAQRYGSGKQVVLAGHSLGGAMAAQYLADEAAAGRSPASGLVLMAAYPPETADLTGLGFPALTLRAGNDGVAEASKVSGGLRLLPPGSREVVIDGAVHAFFGRYGPQAGDGVPTLNRAEAEQRILAALGDYLGGLG